MSQMNPLIGPVLKQRQLYAVKKEWVRIVGNMSFNVGNFLQ